MRSLHLLIVAVWYNNKVKSKIDVYTLIFFEKNQKKRCAFPTTLISSGRSY